MSDSRAFLERLCEVKELVYVFCHTPAGQRLSVGGLRYGGTWRLGICLMKIWNTKKDFCGSSRKAYFVVLLMGPA